MTKQTLRRIRRKHERAVQLLREAHELAAGERPIRAITGSAVDAGEGVLRDWAILDERARQDAAAAARYERELEEFGRCTKCDTGAAASHVHCEACGWSMYAFGSSEQQCHNEACELYERPQTGVRYSDREAVV